MCIRYKTFVFIKLGAPIKSMKALVLKIVVLKQKRNSYEN